MSVGTTQIIVDPPHCPNCRKKLDGCTGPNNGQPESGCYSICVYCEAVNIFVDEHTLRPATDKEILDGYVEHDLGNVLAVMRETKRRVPFSDA